MSKEKHDFAELKPYLPNGSFDAVMKYIIGYKIQLTLTKSRRTILGDYRRPVNGRGHRISINANLNQYSFLITLLHEIAHLTTFEIYGNNVKAHGQEWKSQFGEILANFISINIFPEDIKQKLGESIKNPAASSCADDSLLRVLKKYDQRKIKLVFVDQIDEGKHFVISGGRVFKKGPKLRKRYKCMELSTSKWFLFSPVYEVKSHEVI